MGCFPYKRGIQIETIYICSPFMGPYVTKIICLGLVVFNLRFSWFGTLLKSVRLVVRMLLR